MLNRFEKLKKNNSKNKIKMFKGKHALVTGGSSGIGFEVAKEYVLRGANVTIVARNKNKLDTAYDSLKIYLKEDQKLLSISLDVSSSEKEVLDGLQISFKEIGDVDIIINCAGTSVAGEFDAIDSNEFLKMYNTNVMGTIYPTRAVTPSMKQVRYMVTLYSVDILNLHGQY
jgi:3-dehydrosphinganine reductase